VGLLVSHDRALLEALTTRTARLHHGQLALTSGHYGEARRSGTPSRRGRASSERRHEPGNARPGGRWPRHAADRAAAERALSGSTRDPKDRDARGVGAQTRRAWAEARLGGDVRRLRTAVERARRQCRTARSPRSWAARSPR
jgi:ATPase subunit of ABC transporter with duplicated ATPase domains